MQQYQYHDLQRELSLCGYCDNVIDYSIYKEFGTGHTENCMVKDNWLDEDFARWSEFHLDANGDYKHNHCPTCGISIEEKCNCHIN